MLTRPRSAAGRLKALLQSREGAVAPLIAILMLVLIGCVGLGIDVGRAAVVKARLVSALDAAGLAVGARTTTTDFNADARKYVDANFKANYVGATVTSVTATPNSDKTVITLTASATMPTALMKLFGTNSVTITHTTEVTRKSIGLEVVLVLDNTGSMDSSGSMPTLKDAANSLMDTLFGKTVVGENLYVGLVPFSHTVNAGLGHPSWMTGSKPTGWSGCVMARYLSGLDQTDDPPQSAAYKFEYYRYPAFWSGWYYYNMPNLYCPQPVIPLTNQKVIVTAGINAMTADGNTHINLGAIWGWRMISPRWRGYWDSGTLPLDYKTPNMNKAVILMTDGDNTMSSGVYTAYADLGDGRLGTTNASVAKSALDARLGAVCTKMKSAGIIVYTVAFDNPDPSTKSMLQNCATSTAFAFDAGNKAELIKSFEYIGDSLSSLRVSK